MKKLVLIIKVNENLTPDLRTIIQKSYAQQIKDGCVVLDKSCDYTVSEVDIPDAENR